MEPMSLEGSYADEAGIDQVTWSIADSNRPGWAGRYEIRVVFAASKLAERTSLT